MLKGILYTCVLVGCFTSACVAATAQEVVHALTGTVSSIDANGKAITIFTDRGSEALFNFEASSKVRIAFEKKIRADAAESDAFKKTGAYVIVFYFGNSNVRTAIAFRSLGSGPFTSETGTVVKFESREHSVSIKDDSGAVQSFKITPETIGETGIGVVGGFKFQLQNGDRVRVVASAVDGSPTALFVTQM